MDTAVVGTMSHYAASLVSSLGKAEFCQQLAKLLRWQARHDSLVVILYRLNDKPLILYDGMDRQDRAALLGKYFDGAYLLSPFYLHWQAGMAGPAMLRLADITPEGFFEGIYYTHYYARSGLVDEVGYLVPLDGENGLLVSVGRMGSAAAFSTQELAFLHGLTPLVAAAASQHYARSTLPHAETVRGWLKDGLRLFGSSVLTGREQGVLQLMLHGHSSKSCARLLGISPTTERVHRRNIYTKLDISSQSELFTLFFDAISRDNLQGPQDPLLRLQT